MRSNNSNWASLFALFSVKVAVGVAVAQQFAGSPMQEESLRVFLRSYVAKKPFGDDKSIRYARGFIDLNGDGTSEAVVYLLGNQWCGSGGCPTLILASANESYRVVARILITRPPIRVFSNRVHGWRTLGVWVQGGGILPGYMAEVPFDGATYPINPTVPPARKSRLGTVGDLLVKSTEEALPLYP